MVVAIDLRDECDGTAREECLSVWRSVPSGDRHSDAFGRPLALVVMDGNTNDCTQFTTVVEAIRVPRVGQGRPRTKPSQVVADKGYSSRMIRACVHQWGIGRTIPERADQVRNRLRRGSRGGRPPAFDQQVYTRRTWWNGASTA